MNNAILDIEKLARDLKREQAAVGSRITTRVNTEMRRAVSTMPLFSIRRPTK